MDLSAEPLYEIEPSKADDKKSAQKAAKSLAASVAKLHGAAPMPQSAQQLLGATESENFKVPEIVKILETDPALAAALMRQVNATSSTRARCASIAQAVTMLGQNALRGAASAASALEVFGSDEAPVAQELVRDARRSALAARVLSHRCGLEGDEMYTCALLHDVGKLMLLRGSDLDYPELIKRTLPDQLHLEERARFGFDHALLAGHVLTAWKLPQSISRAVAWHHQPSRAYAAKGTLPKMVALVRLADRLARMDVGALAPDAEAVMQGMPAELGVLGLAPDNLGGAAEDVAIALRARGEEDGEFARSIPAPKPSLPPIAELHVKHHEHATPPPLPKHLLHASPLAHVAWPITAAALFAGGAIAGRFSWDLLRAPLEFGLAIGACALIVVVAGVLLGREKSGHGHEHGHAREHGREHGPGKAPAR